MEFQIHDAAGGQYYWKIVANNGRTLASSERYYNKSDARSACDSVKSWDASAPILDKTSTAAAGGPYGIYDVAANTGWVSVGTDHDTAAFAVASLRRWWGAHGRAVYPRARRVLITADAGGSNSYRTRAWKSELAAFAAETGLSVTHAELDTGQYPKGKVVTDAQMAAFAHRRP